MGRKKEGTGSPGPPTRIQEESRAGSSSFYLQIPFEIKFVKNSKLGLAPAGVVGAGGGERIGWDSDGGDLRTQRHWGWVGAGLQQRLPSPSLSLGGYPCLCLVYVVDVERHVIGKEINQVSPPPQTQVRPARASPGPPRKEGLDPCPSRSHPA